MTIYGCLIAFPTALILQKPLVTRPTGWVHENNIVINLTNIVFKKSAYYPILQENSISLSSRDRTACWYVFEGNVNTGHRCNSSTFHFSWSCSHMYQSLSIEAVYRRSSCYGGHHSRRTKLFLPPSSTQLQLLMWKPVHIPFTGGIRSLQLFSARV